MEKLQETGGAVAGEGTPGFAGGPEPGTAGVIESKDAQEASKGGVRRFTASGGASDPKSEGAPLSESTQVTVSQEAGGEPADDERKRLGVLLGVPEIPDPDLVALAVSWGALPKQIRITIRTLVAATLRAPHPGRTQDPVA